MKVDQAWLHDTIEVKGKKEPLTVYTI